MRRLPLFLLVLLSGCALPRWPVEGPMTSPWGLRMDGWLPEVHRGVDIAVPTGTPIRAMSGGTVEFAGTMSGYGHTVVLRHWGETRTLYAHLSELRVKTGDRVRGQDVIALSGASGNASGPHLHFEVRRGESTEDPVPLLGRAPSTTLPKSSQQRN